MKRLLFIVLAMIATITSFAQQKDVTSFLGIPVDGTVLSMKQKLVSKGFVPKKVGTTEFLEGEFNGTDVRVYIATNNNKVCRIMLCDENYQNETNLYIRLILVVFIAQHDSTHFVIVCCYVNTHICSIEFSFQELSCKDRERVV